MEATKERWSRRQERSEKDAGGDSTSTTTPDGCRSWFDRAIAPLSLALSLARSRQLVFLRLASSAIFASPSGVPIRRKKNERREGKARRARCRVEASVVKKRSRAADRSFRSLRPLSLFSFNSKKNSTGRVQVPPVHGRWAPPPHGGRPGAHSLPHEALGHRRRPRALQVLVLLGQAPQG